MSYLAEKVGHYPLTQKGKHPVERRTTFCGLKIAIETDRGQARKWSGGETKMYYPYGYFEGTKYSNVAGDGMALDVYVGPHEDAENVYVIRQLKGDFETFDELKVMLGFESEKRARVAYLMHMGDEERRIGGIDTYSLAEFKARFIDAGEVEKALVNLLMQPQQPVAMMPMGMPGMMPMMQQGPPPIDVDTYDGVKALIGRVGGMKEQELVRVVEKIWGPGYQYINATPEHVRAEVKNYLLDQRDLLALLQPLAPPSSMSSSTQQPGQSMGSPQTQVAGPVAPTSPGASTSTTPPSASSRSSAF